MQTEWLPPGDAMRAAWEAWAADAPLSQSWAYGAAMRRLGATVRRAVVRSEPGGAPVALAQFTARRVLGLADVALCARGPHWLAPLEDHAKAAAYRALRRNAPFRWPRLTLFQPEEAAGCDGGPRAAGLRRVMSGYATVLLDLAREPEALRASLHGKWRNRLAAAERSALRVEPCGLKPRQYRWLLEAEERQRAANGYAGLPTHFPGAYQEAAGPRRSLRIFRADMGRETAAAMLFLVHGAGRPTIWAGAGQKVGASARIISCFGGR